MLSREHNELLTRTGPGTPMGELIRRYWVPALLAEEIPAADCPPAKVRILGAELVAFRDSQGRVGLLEERCSHRGTSLYYGRNEECGLRCIYHGWKYDVEGNVVETPAEPTGSDFKKKLRHPAYPTVEAAGVVFAYLGPREKMPLFPRYTWTLMPKSRTYVTKSLLECNYLQGLEGECDSSHLSFLHRMLKGSDSGALYYEQDSSPVYEVEETDFGMRLVALRRAGPDRTYVRVSSFVMPISCWVPARYKETHIYVPIDDTHAWRYDLGFIDREVTEEDVHRKKQIGTDYHRIRNSRNDYLQDRRMQKTVNFTGIEDFLNHDACATESMGPIYDRTQEHLGVSDKAVIAVRKFLINSVNGLKEGKEPVHLVRDPGRNHFPHIDTIAETIPANIHWRHYFKHLTESTDLQTPAAVPGIAPQA